MIARLKGIIDTILTNSIILDVQGVGYDVSMPSNALNSVQVGDTVIVEIITVVREDAFMLFGFLNREDKQWFEILTGVQGVGAKVALAIQSILTADDLYMAVMAGDNTAFSRANGVGPKLANRIVLELKDKVAKLPADMVVAQTIHTDSDGTESSGKKPVDMSMNSMITDTVSALTNLGFEHTKAYSAIQKCLQQAPRDITTEQLITMALHQLQN